MTNSTRQVTLLTGVLISGAVLTGTAQVSSSAEVLAFSASLESCRSAAATTPHPFMASFIIEHTVAGEKDGACAYRQTMPGKMTMVCALSERGRKALATELTTAVSGGAMRGGSRAAPAEWTRECEIVTADGKRLPMAPRAPAR